jgi:hypothetical protein
MSASRIGEDRAGVRSLGEREPKARSNEPCPMRASSLRPPAGSGEGEAQALSPASIEIQRQRDNAQGHRREADARFARGKKPSYFGHPFRGEEKRTPRTNCRPNRLEGEESCRVSPTNS